MKKTILSLMAIMASAAMFAVEDETAAFQINVLVSGTEVDNIYLTEAPSYTDDFDNGYDANKFFTGNDTLIYSYLDDVALAVVARPSLVGTFITFQANAATTYTLSVVADVAKSGLKIKDTKTNIQYNLVDGTTFEFTQDANSVYLNRFEITSGSTPTGMNQVAGNSLQVTEKRMVNGQLVIIREDKAYNAQGAMIR